MSAIVAGNASQKNGAAGRLKTHPDRRRSAVPVAPVRRRAPSSAHYHRRLSLLIAQILLAAQEELGQPFQSLAMPVADCAAGRRFDFVGDQSITRQLIFGQMLGRFVVDEERNDLIDSPPCILLRNWPAGANLERGK